MKANSWGVWGALKGPQTGPGQRPRKFLRFWILKYKKKPNSVLKLKVSPYGNISCLVMVNIPAWAGLIKAYREEREKEKGKEIDCNDWPRQTQYSKR